MNELDIRTLQEGNFIHVVSSTPGELKVSDTVYKLSDFESLSKCIINGAQVTYDRLKEKLGFIDRIIKVGQKPIQECVIKSIEYNEKYYIVIIDIIDGSYWMSVDLDGKNICKVKVEFLHQVQNILSSITNLSING